VEPSDSEPKVRSGEVTSDNPPMKGHRAFNRSTPNLPSPKRPDLRIVTPAPGRCPQCHGALEAEKIGTGNRGKGGSPKVGRLVPSLLAGGDPGRTSGAAPGAGPAWPQGPGVSREGAPAKARRYLTEGRLIVEQVHHDRVAATCRGDGTSYRLGFDRGRWSCSCPARTDGCAHLVAVRLVVAVDFTDEPVGE